MQSTAVVLLGGSEITGKTDPTSGVNWDRALFSSLRWFTARCCNWWQRWRTWAFMVQTQRVLLKSLLRRDALVSLCGYTVFSSSSTFSWFLLIVELMKAGFRWASCWEIHHIGTRRSCALRALIQPGPPSIRPWKKLINETMRYVGRSCGQGKERGAWPLKKHGVDKWSSAIRVFCNSQLTSLLTAKTEGESEQSWPCLLWRSRSVLLNKGDGFSGFRLSSDHLKV